MTPVMWIWLTFVISSSPVTLAHFLTLLLTKFFRISNLLSALSSMISLSLERRSLHDKNIVQSMHLQTTAKIDRSFKEREMWLLTCNHFPFWRIAPWTRRWPLHGYETPKPISQLPPSEVSPSVPPPEQTGPTIHNQIHILYLYLRVPIKAKAAANLPAVKQH